MNLDGLEFEQVSEGRVLGITITRDLKWNDHISDITAKAAKRPYILSQLKRTGVSSKDLVSFYCSAIRSVVEYAFALFHCSLPGYLIEELERIQKCVLRVILPDLKYRDAINTGNVNTLYDRREPLLNKPLKEILYNNQHELASLLLQRSQCRRLSKNRMFDIPVCQ